MVFLFAALVAAAAPSPKRASDIPPQKPVAASVQKPAEAGNAGTEQSPFVVKVQKTPKTDSEAAEDEDDRRERQSTDRWVIRLTLALAIIGVLQTIVFGIQSWLLKRTIDETRRIGEAQTRAYLSISAADAIFIDMGNEDFQPVIRIVAKNTGQSPARNFVWNPTVQYFSFSEPGRTRQSGFGGNWREIRGVGISAGGEHSDGALISEMFLLRFLREGGTEANSVLMRIRIQFEFEDVFDGRITDEAFFMGTYSRLIGHPPVTTDFGRTFWTGQLNSIHRPNDWEQAEAT